MEDAGHKLKRVRERLGLRYRDVEQASLSIAQRRKNDEYTIALSRLADIENKGTVPTLYRLYSLCAIYRLDLLEVLNWFGVDPGNLAADALGIEHAKTHTVGFSTASGASVSLPMALDPGIDWRRTTHFSRLIQRWGLVPLMLLNTLDLRHQRYGLIGTEDWSMYPLIHPGTFVLIDETRRKPVGRKWTNEFDRPIYFFEHRDGFACGWCTLDSGTLILQSHPASQNPAQLFSHPSEIEILGQVTGIAMRLDPAKPRRTRS